MRQVREHVLVLEENLFKDTLHALRHLSLKLPDLQFVDRGIVYLFGTRLAQRLSSKSFVTVDEFWADMTYEVGTFHKSIDMCRRLGNMIPQIISALFGKDYPEFEEALMGFFNHNHVSRFSRSVH